MAKERVQKIIARAGIASRRHAEDLINEGRVTINGKVASLGDQAEWGADHIKVDGKLLHRVDPPVYWLFHKPKGVLSVLAADPEGRRTLAEFFGREKQRLFPVGRMEFNEEGLLLVTNDGDWAEKLRTNKRIVRVFRIKTASAPTVESLANLLKPSRVEGKLVQTHTARLVKRYKTNALIELSFLGPAPFDLKEFLMRRGVLAERITRFAIGQISIDRLAVGERRALAPSQAKALAEQPELGMRLLKDLERNESAEAKTEAELGTAKPLRLKLGALAESAAKAVGSKPVGGGKGTGVARPTGASKLTAKRGASVQTSSRAQSARGGSKPSTAIARPKGAYIPEFGREASAGGKRGTDVRAANRASAGSRSKRR